MTPLQLQKSSEPLRHDPRTLPGSAEMLDLKQRRAFRSASGLLLVCADEKVALLEVSETRTPYRKKSRWPGDGDLGLGSMRRLLF